MVALIPFGLVVNRFAPHHRLGVAGFQAGGRISTRSEGGLCQHHAPGGTTTTCSVTWARRRLLDGRVVAAASFSCFPIT